MEILPPHEEIFSESFIKVDGRSYSLPHSSTYALIEPSFMRYTLSFSLSQNLSLMWTAHFPNRKIDFLRDPDFPKSFQQVTFPNYPFALHWCYKTKEATKAPRLLKAQCLFLYCSAFVIMCIGRHDATITRNSAFVNTFCYVAQINMLAYFERNSVVRRQSLHMQHNIACSEKSEIFQ